MTQGFKARAYGSGFITYHTISVSHSLITATQPIKHLDITHHHHHHHYQTLQNTQGQAPRTPPHTHTYASVIVWAGMCMCAGVCRHVHAHARVLVWAGMCMHMHMQE